MYLGAVSSGLLHLSFRETTKIFYDLGLTAIEPVAGGNFPKNHCDPEKLLSDERLFDEFQSAIADNQLRVSAYAIHGRPLHPNTEIAKAYDADFRNACLLAEKTDVTRVTLTSGLPAGHPDDQMPNWIVFPHPPEYVEALEWQWEQRAIPYWKERGKFAEDHGVRLCFEMIPAEIVYNPESLLRLRDAVGPVVGCNFDPSHLFFQGIDIMEAIRELKDSIYHVHAKDTRIDPHVTRINGLTDPKRFALHEQRSWLYRTVGYGHGEVFWCDYLSMLRTIGYDDVVSIEHEDQLIDPQEGFEFAIDYLQRILIKKPPVKLWDE